MLGISKWSCRGSSKFTVLSLLASSFSASNSCAFSLTSPAGVHPRFHSNFIMDHGAIAPVSSSRKRPRDSSWDPRFARSCSYCVKRLFQRTFMCTPCGESKEEAREEKRPKKPPRPLNSYLKVVLDEDTMDRLHEISVKLGKDIQAMSANADEEEKEGEAETATKKRKGRPLKFRWRSRKSLHFTFFFGGEVLCAMPPEELISWHENVKERLRKSNFIFESDRLAQVAPENVLVQSTDESSIGTEEVEKNEYWFRIRELSLFPPRRNPYLIVALLQASPAWHELHNDIRNVALNGHSEQLKLLAERDKGGDWIPHITLGNLYGGSKGDKGAVRKMLQEFSLEDETSPEGDDNEIGVKCITVGGPVPQQVKLDWEFENKRKKE